ncbi:MAG: Uncharacterised protein [Candidatus Nitrosopelagicus brevis]|mgnify:FL=1|jgi:hypothetical protein|nr:SRPBCC family protein [Thermoproteota archaeon]MEC9087551.1 SRPBCC family protein [Thermoproteota archaeon]MEC9436588.1 SRPBCC family protein [Thermoproteota archaeon]GIT55492.1 MAG: hypothetical protein Ct9H300mP17_06510 [Candidatus Nitrosopelagicus sp.]CAI8208857.1 MAG: Uncharacterised protein [Candidatus Nitrosopelagicus brevis]|tara:strand:+ start:54 stop:479 length:426 start_codon:yes stop_codon:yes gene_type:complete
MNSGSVKKSVIIETDLEKAWTKISKIAKLDWLEGQKSTKFLGEKKTGVGAKRLISFEDGSKVEEHVVGWKPKEYFSYIAVSGLPLEAYHATISIEKNKTKSIKVTWESYFAAKTTKAEFDEFVEFLSNFYAQSLKNLREKF